MTNLITEEQSSVATSSNGHPIGRPASVFSALFLLLPLFLIFAPKGLVVWMVLAILALPRIEAWPSLAAWRFGPLARVVVLLFLWAFITLAWSPVPSFQKLLSLAAFCIVGGLWLVSLGALDWPARERVRTRLMICFIFAAAFLTLEAVTSLRLGMRLSGEFSFASRLAHIARSAAAVTVTAWAPLALMAREQMGVHFLRGPAVAFAILIILLLDALYLEAYACVVALIVGPLAFLLVYWRRRLGLAIMGSIIIGYLFLAPTLHIWPLEQNEGGIRSTLPLSWQHRIEIWHKTSEKIFENPVFGHGFDSARVMGQESVDVAGKMMQVIPVHPHNAFLQVWLELGLVGVLLLAALIGLMLVGIGSARSGRVRSGVHAATLASYLVIALISFGAWQTWWIAAAWLAAGILLLLGGNPRKQLSQPALS